MPTLKSLDPEDGVYCIIKEKTYGNQALPRANSKVMKYVYHM